MFLLSQTENYTIEAIPKTAELSDITVNCVLQDSEGFMWFGTSIGLYRYDGLDYKIFRHNPFDSLTLSADMITGIAEDSANILWIASGESLCCYDKYHERIERIIDTVGMSDIRDMIDDGKGNIWFGTHMNGLVRFDKKSERILFEGNLLPTDTTRKWEMRELLMDCDGIIWIYSDGPRFWRFDPGSRTYEEISGVPCKLGSLLEDQSGRIWVTSACGLYLFDKETRIFERQFYQPWDPDRLNSDFVCSIMEDGSGNLWVSTFDGVYKYSPGLKLLYHWPYPNPYPPSISDRSSHGLTYEDDAGTIWIFNRDGIFKLWKMQENFSVINPDPPSTNVNRAVYLLNENSLLYGTEKGYYEYNRKDNTFAEYNLSNSLCNCIFEDSHGILWIGTRDGLFRRVESADQTVDHIAYHHIPEDSSSLPGNYIHIIFEDSSGRLWIGCQLAMPCYYDRGNDCFIHLVDNFGIFSLMHKPYMFHETSSKDLIAAAQGAYKIIPPFSKVSEYAVMASDVVEIIPEKPFHDKTAQLYVSCMDSKGIIWFGSSEMGLFKWVDDGSPDISSKGRWALYTTMDGLAGNTIMRIEEDLKGNLWIGTTTGLSRFNFVSETFTNFFTKNGLPSNVFLKSGARSPDGELFFGTNSGVVHFNPESIKLNTIIPQVRITSLKIDNQEVIPSEKSILRKSILFTDNVKLSYRQNSINMSFAALNYIEPERNQYRYMLEGFEEDWVFSGKRNYVSYTNLKPGKYTFRATGSNNDGIWNEEGVALSINVMAPPWRTWWAYIIYGFILTGIIVLYRRYLFNLAKLKADLQIERMEKEKALEIDQMKSRFFANISHEFRTPLTLITGPINDLIRTIGKSDKRSFNLLGMLKRNTQKLQHLINELLELSKLDTGNMKLQVSEGDLSGYLRSIAVSFLSLAEKEKIEYKIDIKEGPVRLFFDRDKVEKIVSNLISNALKFTQEEGLVTVKVDFLSSTGSGSLTQVRIVISDNGPGIPVEEKEKVFDRFHQVSKPNSKYTQGTGIGLALVKELVDLYRGMIELECELGEGSEFIVILPASKEQFNEDEIETVQIESEPISDIYADPGKDGSSNIPAYEPYINKTETEKPIILVVEDNEDLRKYIAQNLDIHYQIYEAGNGIVGLEKATENIPDLVISDLMMPEMDGMELCELLRSDQRTSHIPLIMLTAKADKWSKLDSYEKGADDYILKPFDAVELQSRISNLIAQRKRLREKYRKEFLIEPSNSEAFPELSDDFLIKVLNILNSNLSDSEYSVEQLCQDVGLSQSQLYRKVTALTDHSPVEFIRNIRLKRAAELFRRGQKNVSTVLYSVGFNTPSHFSRYFRELYGVNPSDYIRKIQTITD
ncbi:MAG: hypothetical protein AMS26_21985 [Bacteroides sp. SM23_62]|nr:MAG: hypothetical protein AMS26_21985 [Bacteroides sp. SM23_62]